ncbi:hypothetical protein H4582DRAFT_2077990 [Lactarius indigo]|nr:hypothetical protein H4582DRAFT_2077990 [Lactarius indigo]
MLPFTFNSTDTDQEEEVIINTVMLCAIAIVSIFGAREARNEERRHRRRTLHPGELHPNPRVGTPRQRLRESQEDRGGSDDSSEEDDSMSTTEASTSDEDFSLDDDDDEPPLVEKRGAPAATKTTTQSFEMGESISGVKIANGPLPLPKKASAPTVKSDDEDSGDNFMRAVPAQGKGKATQGGKRKSLDNDDEESDAYIRPIKKGKTTARATVTESLEKNSAGVKLASKTTTVRKL